MGILGFVIELDEEQHYEGERDKIYDDVLPWTGLKALRFAEKT